MNKLDNHNYDELQKQIEGKVKKSKYESWRGDLSKDGIKSIKWGDLRELEVK